MKVTIKIPAELADRARAQGLKLENYVENLLAQQAAAPVPNAQKFRTPKDIRAWLDSLAQFSDKIPPLPETISREWIYQEHE